jgi:hypothetical protein
MGIDADFVHFSCISRASERCSRVSRLVAARMISNGGVLMPKKRRRATRRRETLNCSIDVSSFRASLRVRVDEPRNPVSEIEVRLWLELRGTLNEAVGPARDVVLSLYPDARTKVGTARPPGCWSRHRSSVWNGSRVSLCPIPNLPPGQCAMMRFASPTGRVAPPTPGRKANQGRK